MADVFVIQEPAVMVRDTLGREVVVFRYGEIVIVDPVFIMITEEIVVYEIIEAVEPAVIGMEYVV